MLVTSRNTLKTSTSHTLSSATTRKQPARQSKRRSKIASLERPRRDDFCEILSENLQKMHEHMTLREMAESTWVSPATLSRYKNNQGRYIRSDTLRGILRIFGLKLKIEK